MLRLDVPIAVKAEPIDSEATVFGPFYLVFRNLDTTLRQHAERIAKTSPFDGRVERLCVESVHMIDHPRVVICIPVCNESDRIEACLEAIERSRLMAAPGGAGDDVLIVLFVNNSSDASRARALQVARSKAMPLAIVEARLHDTAASAGFARRFALDLGSALVEPDGTLISTDADTIVGDDWLAAHSHALGNADFSVGPIEIDAGDRQRLPASALECRTVETELFDALARLWSILVPDEPPVLTMKVGGANFAVRARAYRRVGGLPAIPAGEDRAMLASILRADLTVAAPSDAAVHTSGRLDGRTVGGMADALRRKASDADPLCDDRLMMVRQLVERALRYRSMKAEISERSTSRIPNAPFATAMLLDACPQHSFAASWDAIEDRFEPLRIIHKSCAESELAICRTLCDRLLLADHPPSDTEVATQLRACVQGAERVR